MEWVSWLIWAMGLGFVGMYVVGPVLTRFTMSHEEFPAYEPTGEGDLTGRGREFVGEVVRAMAAEGFTTVASLKMRGSMGVKGGILLFVNRGNGDMGSAVFASNGVGGFDVMYGFDTRYREGPGVVTLMWSNPGVYPEGRPHERRLVVPGVKDARVLYRVHRRRVEMYGASGGEVDTPEQGEEVRRLRLEQARDWEWLVGIGYYQLDGRRHRYVPTWKGAILMTWKQCWPVKQVRGVLMRRGARRELRELGLEPLPVVEGRAAAGVVGVVSAVDAGGQDGVVLGFPAVTKEIEK